MTAPTVGFIGLGAMGLPMAQRIASAGHPVLAVEASPARCDQARAADITVGDVATLREADLVIVMVATADQLHQVLAGPDGALSVMAVGTTCVVMSTVGPAAVEKIGAQAAECGVDVLDVPVTGGVSGAEAGTLSLLVGGDPEVVTRVEDVLRCLGSILLCGSRVGDGQAVKVINQLLCSVHLAAAAEALMLAERLGLDSAKVLEAVNSGAGSSWMLGDRGPRMLEDTPEPLTMLDIFVKDSTLVAEAAADAGFGVPILEAARERFRRAADSGYGRCDDSEVRRAYL
ncbi:beta-hydroxyacid dehydrogenase [Mycolicibacterium murale]|uniref:Beta-hydroxyacid dehydrogenase n=1 Tax=Mycolicibacterium murale TaxID=182220 RepID=A0A7I9WG26_9MYCO|nr:NAD(P)-dependent oxidoreductase [Mycolicibacterium murale]MCV7183124.1 NAD(P)-dependent oxidoreductase [Mycolicibacterium murale]GFG56682.1 beta-hydroxyacid dehydrogenase [Mycolicibacterium murale]